MATTDLTIRPFEVHVPDEDLADLRRRIAATRWPGKELVADRSQGVQLATIQELARYWAAGYDWRACEERLNALPQFTTEIDGTSIHSTCRKAPRVTNAFAAFALSPSARYMTTAVEKQISSPT